MRESTSFAQLDAFFSPAKNGMGGFKHNKRLKQGHRGKYPTPQPGSMEPDGKDGGGTNDAVDRDAAILMLEAALLEGAAAVRALTRTWGRTATQSRPTGRCGR